MPERLAEYLKATPAISGMAAPERNKDLAVGYWQIPPVKERHPLRRAADGVRDALRRLRKQLPEAGRLADLAR